MNKRHSQLDGLHRLTLRSLALAVALVCTCLISTAYAASAASEQEAAQIALQQNGNTGKVLGVSTEQDKNGNKVFAVKVLSNGRVRIIRIAQTP